MKAKLRCLQEVLKKNKILILINLHYSDYLINFSRESPNNQVWLFKKVATVSRQTI